MPVIAISPYSKFNDDTILIGVNCIDKENIQKVRELELQIINPYKDHDDLLNAAEYCWSVSLDCCEHLAKLLNQVHSVCYSQAYWKTLLLVWVTAFVENLYDRYLRLCLVREKFPDTVIEIPQIELFSPLYKKSLDIYGPSHLHSTNIKIYYLLIKLMRLNPRVKKLDAKLAEATQTNTSLNIKQFVKKLLRVGNFRKADSFLWHLDKTGIKLLGLSQKRDWFHWWVRILKDDGFSKQAIDRRKITFESTGNEFEDILHKFVQWAIPIAFFEEYRERCDTAKRFLQRKKIITWDISSTFLGNDTLKFLLAEIRESGGKIRGKQHGGGYGNYVIATVERVEREIFDYFITWGWNDKSSCHTIPLPDPRLSILANTHKKKSNNILFIGSHGPMYMFRYQGYWIPEFVYSKYYTMKQRFFENLKESAKKSILYRPYVHEYGWNEKEKIKEILPSVHFDNSGTAVSSMKTCSLVVIDHPGTSFLEALVINVPTLLFWDNEQTPMREEAKPYFRLLTDAGILYYDPINTAKKVNEIAENPEIWWKSQNVQSAIKRFCRHFAWASLNWKNIWVKELKQIQSNV